MVRRCLLASPTGTSWCLASKKYAKKGELTWNTFPALTRRNGREIGHMPRYIRIFYEYFLLRSINHEKEDDP